MKKALLSVFLCVKAIMCCTKTLIHFGIQSSLILLVHEPDGKFINSEKVHEGFLGGKAYL